MKYAQLAAMGLYLIFAAGLGAVLLRRASDQAGRLMALAAGVLFAGSACHLVPQALSLLIKGDLRLWLGLGRLAAALALTGFSLLLYCVWERVFRRDVRDRTVFWMVIGLCVLRLLLCAAPGNGWTENEHSPLWAALRTLPQGGLAAAVVMLYRLTRDQNRDLAPLWLLQLLAFLCYLPAVGDVPATVWLMILQALCQLGTLICLVRYEKNRS